MVQLDLQSRSTQNLDGCSVVKLRHSSSMECVTTHHTFVEFKDDTMQITQIVGDRRNPNNLIPRPFKRRRKGLVHTVRTCTGVSILTSHITIVIVCRFCMTCSSMDDKRRVYDSIRLPHIFLESPAHAHAICTRPFLQRHGKA